MDQEEVSTWLVVGKTGGEIAFGAFRSCDLWLWPPRSGAEPGLNCADCESMYREEGDDTEFCLACEVAYEEGWRAVSRLTRVLGDELDRIQADLLELLVGIPKMLVPPPDKDPSARKERLRGLMLHRYGVLN